MEPWNTMGVQLQTGMADISIQNARTTLPAVRRMAFSTPVATEGARGLPRFHEENASGGASVPLDRGAG